MAESFLSINENKDKFNKSLARKLIELQQNVQFLVIAYKNTACTQLDQYIPVHPWRAKEADQSKTSIQWTPGSKIDRSNQKIIFSKK